MLHYLAPFLALGAALLGILGNTHDPRKKGWRRITRVGWWTATLAAATLAFGIWQAWEQDREQRILANQRAQLAAIGAGEICAASLQLKAAFDILHGAATRDALPDGRDLGYPFKDLMDKGSLDSLGALDLLTNPPARPIARDSRPLWQLVHHRAEEFTSRTNATLAKYGAYLDPELVVRASLLLNDNFVQSLLEMPSNVEHLRQIPGAALSPLQAGQIDDYRTSINHLAGLMEKIEADPERLTCKPLVTSTPR